MSIAKIQTGDSVKIISGNYRGTVGVVTKVVKKNKPNGNQQVRASVSTVPKIAKFRKSQTVQGQKYPGSKLDVDRMIDISNISLVNGDNQVSRVKIILDNGKKVRTYKNGGAAITKQTLPKPEKTELAK